MAFYNHKKIEKKWQKEWEKTEIYKTPDEKKGAENFYTLVEFPYPSGNLHTGHWYAFSVPDIFARKKRMEGKNVLFPIGFDAFGLPAENAAIKRKINPKKWTYENIDYMRKQIKSMGASFDWSREVITCDPEYYKWTQWIFLQFFKKGLAYQAETPVNWCPKDKTVLANEQVASGKCERCGAEVEQKQMKQWMLRITDYAERLLAGLDKLNWKEEIKEAQRNWIGKSEGAEIEFKINPLPTPSPREGEEIPAFIQSEKDKNLEKILLRLLDLSNKNKKRLILSGGWAVDIYAGRRIRNHDDIDGNIPYTDVQWWKEALAEIEFRQIPPDDPKKDPSYHLNFVKKEKGVDYKIDLIGIGFDEKKQIYDMEWGKPDPWSFIEDDIINKTFKGRTVEIFSAPVQLWLKVFDREKDKIDRAVLAQNQYLKEEGKFGYQTTDPKTWRALQERTREMRAYPTKAEEILWQSLRKNLIGFHFRRQHIIGRFVVDFMCLERSLIVEVDGDIHDYQKTEDEERTALLKDAGFRIIRFHNEEVLGKIGAVVKKIKKELRTLPLGEGKGGVVKVFTTRPDTLFGATYIVLAPEHPLIANYKLQITNYKEVEKYIEKTRKKTPLQRQQEIKEKTGVELKGIKAVNPANKEEIPIWIADYVLMDYGTGAIMAVPQHDKRDMEFAVKFNLPIIDMPLVDKNEIVKKVGGKMVTQYKLRDWVVSRQRYWGVPIPIIHCAKCGPQPAKEKDLPIELPEISAQDGSALGGKDYLPTGEGKSPLAKATKWLSVKCQKCGSEAKRETDTLDTFVDSSWYFLRYCDPQNKKEFADVKKLASFMPVDLYSGGAEHTTMHLLYSRFWYKAMYDCGLIPKELGDEPYKERRNRGIILGPDGQKMSKSKGNVIDPDEYVEKLGADTVRMYLAFIGPYNEVGSFPWDPRGILGIKRFLDRIWNLASLASTKKLTKAEVFQDFSQRDGARLSNSPAGEYAGLEKSSAESILRTLHKTIKQVSENIDDFKFNTAISSLMILLNEMEKQPYAISPASPAGGHTPYGLGHTAYGDFLKILAPFAPHLAEELWHRFFVNKKSRVRDLQNKSGSKTSIHLESWPQYDPTLIEENTFELIIQINGKIRDKFEAPINISQAEAERLTLAREKVKLALENKKPRRVVFIPKRLINLVV